MGEMWALFRFFFFFPLVYASSLVGVPFPGVHHFVFALIFAAKFLPVP